MKKIFKWILIFIVVFLASFFISSCILNKQKDANAADFRYAMIYDPTGELIKEGYVDGTIIWSGDTVDVTMADGEKYKTHTSNVILITRKDLIINKEGIE